MFEQEVQPRLARLGGDERLFTRELRITGLPESEVEQRISPIYALYPDAETTILARRREFSSTCASGPSDAAKAKQVLDEIVKAHRAGARRTSLFHRGRDAGRSRRARAHGKSRHDRRRGKLHRRPARRAAHAHSRQLGYFLGGVVCYSNDLKRRSSASRRS